MMPGILKPKAHRGERGQSLVELAISLTVMLLLLSGAVSFGIALFSYVAVRDAAGEGSLYGSVSPYHDQGTPPSGTYDPGEPPNYDAICGRVKFASTAPVNMSGFTCTQDVYANGGTNTGNKIDISLLDKNHPCEYSIGGAGGTPNAITITVDYDQPIIMPYVGAITGQNIHLRATSTDTILQPRCP